MKLEHVRLSSNDKIALISNLSTMLSAGIPILEAVESILEGAKGGAKIVLETLRNDLTQGRKVSVTFAKFPQTFDRVIVNIVHASEEAGTLDITLKDLIQSIKKENEFSDKVKSAMIYPVFILVVFAAVMIMILTVVMPKISTVFLRLKVDLPLPTRIMIFLSNLIMDYTLIIVVLTIILSFGLIYLIRAKRKMFIQLIASFPLFSQLAKEIDLTHFTRSAHLLLNAGIPITTVLELTGETVTRRDVAKAINHAKTTVASGKKLSESFKLHKTIFPSIIVKITEAGEKSGTLDKAMGDASEYLDYQVSNSLRIATALIEPLMLVVVGILIGGMMLAIIAPIYNLIGQVG